MMFVKFVETNDSEGETWNFWLQLDGNEAALKALSVLISASPDNELPYELFAEPVPEFEVDILVKHTDGGYMDYQNKVTGTLILPETLAEGLTEADIDELCNGGIRKIFTDSRS